jgi:hypothetical protein
MQEKLDPILSEEVGSGTPFVQLSQRRIGYRNLLSSNGWPQRRSIALANQLPSRLSPLSKAHADATGFPDCPPLARAILAKRNKKRVV